MICSCRWTSWLLLLLPICLSACQPLSPTGEAKLTQPAAPAASSEPSPAVRTIAHEALPAAVDWAAASDCRGKLALFRLGLNDGRIMGLEDSPFRLMTDDPLDMHEAWRAAGSSAVSRPCVVRVGRAHDLTSDHRVLRWEQVRSSYQSGARTEKNPAYDVAKARLRQAEKATKPGKSSKVKLGDPLMDLVGTLVGGALTGLGQWGRGDELEEAMDELLQTPRSIEKPRYQHYHFERALVRAVRAATVPITLTDRSLEKSWQVKLKRREVRTFTVLEGLDPRDRDYASHRQDSLTDDGLRQWLAASPTPSLVDMVQSLLDRPAAIPIDRLALAGTGPMQAAPGSVADFGPIAGDVSMDAAALPRPRLLDAGRVAAARASSVDGVSSVDRASGGIIKVIGEAGPADGVFVAPHFILTSSEVIGARGLVDVEDGPDHRALGLVAAVDHGLGLALVQAPVSGQPIAIDDGLPISAGYASTTPPAHDANSAPLLVNGKLVGVRDGQRSGYRK
ncbi:MAG: hypothetical protein OEU92_01005 [Alphaproteobacteria bacterium]|nr:hypothetical protein [Alphaproteobacteria bacterium]